MSERKQGPKSQHTVPRCYLKSWTDPETPAGHEPYVWVLEVATGEVRQRAPKNVFTENDFYTIKGPDGFRDLRLENGLHGLETRFDRIRGKILAGRVAPDET